MLAGRKKRAEALFQDLVPTIAPMVSVTATYIGASDDDGSSPIHGSCADATARTADHCNTLDIRGLELSQGGERHRRSGSGRKRRATQSGQCEKCESKFHQVFSR